MLGLHPKWRETFMEAWPDSVMELGLKPECVLLSEQDCLAIGARTSEFRDLFDIDELPRLTDDFRDDVARKITAFGAGAHARLGGCSFKKPGRNEAAVFNVKQLETLMLQENPRVAGLLASSLQEDFPVSLYLRPWVQIPHWAEFRLFMKQGVFLGASQYFHTLKFAEVETNLRPIAQALVDFSARFQDATHVEDAIVDVFIEPAEGAAFRAVLIDVNPLIWRADSCLFSWKNDGDFDKGLRFRGRSGKIHSFTPLPFAPKTGQQL